MNECLRRTLRTAFQTAIGYIAASVPTVDWSADKAKIKAVITGIIITAVSSGIAAAMNYKED